MKYRQLSLISILLLFCIKSFAQKDSANVKGRVQSEDGSGIDGAVVSILQQKDSSVIKILITEKDGTYSSETLLPNNYLLGVTQMGYVNYFGSPFTMDASGNSMEISAIQLKQDSKELSGVTVEAKKNLVEKKMDRTIINVNSFIGNAGNNMMEVLQKSPGVSVDETGNIKLKGRAGVVVYIDDRPTYMSTEDLANYLRSLPSSSVDIMEIMTNPPAKYDAAGNAGVINIRLKKTKAQGFNGGFNLSYSQGRYPKSGNSFNFNYRVNKVNFFSNISYNIYNSFQDLDIERKYYKPTGEPLSAFQQNSYLKNESKGFNAKIGMDYYINKKSTFGIVLAGFQNNDSRPVANNASIIDSAGNVSNFVKADATSKKVLKNKSINLNYNYKIDSSGKEVTVNLDYLDYDGRLKSDLLNSIYMPNGDFSSQTNLIGDLPSTIKIATAKIDYTHPLKRLGTFGAGAKTSFIKTNNDANFYDENNGILTVNNDFTNNFTYKENINAAYVNYSFERKRFSAQAGLRFENTNITGLQMGNQTKPDSSYNRTLNNLFPTVYLNYKLDSADKNQFGFTYGKRIDRPNYQDMNPFTYPLDRFTLYGGNPFLKPTISHNFELSHTYKNILTTAFQVNYVKDLISETIEQTNGIFYSRPGNFGQQFSYGLTVNLNFSPLKWWTVQLYNELIKDNFKATLYDQQVNNSGVHWSVNGTSQFQITQKWSAEVSGYYNTKVYYAQFILIQAGSFSVSVSRKLMKDNATLKLNFNDPFYVYRTGGNIIGLNNSAANWHSKLDTRVVGIAFSYRFNKGKSLKARNSGGSDSEKGRVH